MGDVSDYQLGQTVELQDGRRAIVRFVGGTQFAPGSWIGVELENASGKNDGSVQGERYFECTAGRGMFLRPAALMVIEQPVPRSVKMGTKAFNGNGGKSRMSNAFNGLALDGEKSNAGSSARRQSAQTSNQTSTQLSRSPSKSPTKKPLPRMSGIGPVSRSNNLSVLGRQPVGAVQSRQSFSGRTLATSTRKPPRPSASLQKSGNESRVVAPAQTSRTSSNRLAILQKPPQPSSTCESSQASVVSDQESLEASEGTRHSLPPSEKGDGSSSAIAAVADPPSLERFMSQSPRTAFSLESAALRHPRGAPAIDAGPHKEVEDLKARIRAMEKRRMEDRDKLKGLEQVQHERDRFESIIQKLQAKLQPQQQEVVNLRKRMKEAEARAEATENGQIEIETAIEMATLDREMAEETAEVYKAELDALRQKCQELELEAEILREENQELGQEMSPEERASQGWLQMERSNERLRGALVRLRDMTQEREAEMKEQIDELEKDSQELVEERRLHSETHQKLMELESVAEDLRQQLEASLGAEEIIEDLSERNASLTERMEELKSVIEDLESLKDLNDELELNHVESEKQLQDEIDYRDVLQTEQLRKISAQDESIEELEYTILRYRDLVSNLQNDLEDLKASHQTTESEAQELNSRSRAMMDLNMRLQVSASRAQVRAIDIELRKLEVQEAKDHLSIVQNFLPESYSRVQGAVYTYLRFKRIDFKANIVHEFVRERLNSVAVHGHEEDIFTCCEILDKLTWVCATCNRFVQYIESCSLEVFKRLEGVFHDLEPVEKAVNGWTDTIKRDSLQEKQCAADLQRFIALIAHLSEIYFEDDPRQQAEEVCMRALGMQSNLEGAALAVGQIKSVVQAKIILPTDADEGDEHEARNFLDSADSLISQIRSAKIVASKAVHQLKELKSRALALNPSKIPLIERLQEMTSGLSASCISSGIATAVAVNEENRENFLTYPEVTQILCPNDPSPFYSLRSRIQALATQIQHFRNLTNSLSQAIEIPISSNRQPPWVLLAQKLSNESAVSVGHEKEAGRLRDELESKNATLVMRDKMLDELSVRTEVLEKRAAESGGYREKLRESETLIVASRAQEKVLSESLSTLKNDLDRATVERDKWIQKAATLSMQRSSSSNTAPISSPPALVGHNAKTAATPTAAGTTSTLAQHKESLQALESEVSVLRSTVRYLRLSRHSQTLRAAHAFLEAPLVSTLAHDAYPARYAKEADDILKSMFDLIQRPSSQGIQLHPAASEKPLAWRPKRETVAWQARRQLEEWEAWREWRDDLDERSQALERETKRKKLRGIVGRSSFATYGLDSAKLDKREDASDVRITRPERGGAGGDYWPSTSGSLAHALASEEENGEYEK